MNVPRITLVADSHPLFVGGRIAGGIGVVDGTEEQDCAVSEYLAARFRELVG